MTVRVTPWKPGPGGEKRWMVDVRTTRADDTKARDRKVIVGTRTAARGWGDRRQAVLLGELRAPVREVDPPEDVGPRAVLTVAEWVPKMERHYQAAKRSSADSAMSLLQTHVVQLVGEVPLDGLRQSLVDELEATWRKGGYRELRRDRIIQPTDSRKTINNRRMVLLSMLAYAIECSDESGLTAMPCKIKLAKVDAQKAPPFYEVEQYTVMAKAAAQMKDPRALVIVLLGGEAGLRVGEMMALKWSDVNYRARRLTIRASVYQRTVTERFEDVVKGGLEKPIPMSKRLFASLRRLERTKNGDYVLQSDGEPMSWRALAWVIMRVERSVGMPETGRAHVLRHTYCSHLAQAGVPARTIQEMGRHADLTTTMRYMHLAKDAKENAVRDLEKLRAAQR